MLSTMPASTRRAVLLTLGTNSRECALKSIDDDRLQPTGSASPWANPPRS